MKKFVIIIIVAISLASCGSSNVTSLYGERFYGDPLYQCLKNPTDEKKVFFANACLAETKAEGMLQKAEEGDKQALKWKKYASKTRLRLVTPPGIYAELGFLYCMGIGPSEFPAEYLKILGISYLKKEIELYPESEMYVTRIINQFEK